MDVTSDKAVASARVGMLWLAAVGELAITDAAWREYLEFSAASVQREGPFSGVLFWGPKHGPSAHQRKMLTEEYAEAVRIDAQQRVVTISDSTVVRGALTAINWFAKKNLRAFPSAEVERGLDWLAEEIAFDRQQAARALEQIIAAVGRHKVDGSLSKRSG